MKHSPNPYDPLYQEPDEELTDDNAIELITYASTLESMISGDFNLNRAILDLKQESLSFVRTGLLAYKIKLYKVYKKKYGSFRDFCEKALGVTHWQINRSIEAARVVIELAQAGFSILPKCESQCRPLWQILSEFGTGELCAKWQTVIETLQEHKITHKTICCVLGMEKSNKDNIRIDRELAAKLRIKAAQSGQTVEEYLDEILDEDDAIEEIEEEKLANWHNDLDIVVREEEEKQVWRVIANLKAQLDRCIAIGNDWRSKLILPQPWALNFGTG